MLKSCGKSGFSQQSDFGAHESSGQLHSPSDSLYIWPSDHGDSQFYPMQPVFQGYPPYGSPQWIYPEDVQSRYTDTPGFCHSSYPDSYDPNVNQPLAISYAGGISCNSAGSAPGWEISSGYSGSFFRRDAQSNLISAVNRHQTRSGAEIDRIELFGDEKQQFEGLVELALREWCERILVRFRMVDLFVVSEQSRTWNSCAKDPEF